MACMPEFKNIPIVLQAAPQPATRSGQPAPRSGQKYTTLARVFAAIKDGIKQTAAGSAAVSAGRKPALAARADGDRPDISTR